MKKKTIKIRSKLVPWVGRIILAPLVSIECKGLRRIVEVAVVVHRCSRAA